MSDKDVAEIIAVHEAWMYSNVGLDIDKMVVNFANPGYHQYNLNGFTYDLDEKIRLWEGFHEVGTDLEMTKVQEPFVYVHGDLAYLIDEWDVVILGTGASGHMVPQSDTLRVRFTEVFRRDDGQGNAEWRIWHFHASFGASEGATKFPQDA